MNKGITLLLLGVIACAMGIVLFLQMGQRNTNEMLSNQDVLISSIENATKTIPPAVTPKPVTETPPPLIERTAPIEDLIKKEIEEPMKKTVQQEIATQEKAPIEQKALSQEKSSLQQNVTQPVATTTNSSTSSDAKAPEHQIKENSTKKTEAKSTNKKLIPTTKADISSGAKGKKPTPVAKTDISSGATGTHEMSSLTVQFSGSTVHVVIKADSSFAYKTMLLSSPDRLVIDLPGTWKKVATATTPKNRLLEKIRIGSQPSGPRIVLDLKVKPKKYALYKIDSSTLEIVIE